MCGIAGYVGFPPPKAGTLAKMLDTITHRGPDDCGEWLDGDMGLGMRRLSIIDVVDGHQPMSTEDGRYIIVMNGELYNFQELRRQLERDGVRFRTRSDTEVVLRSFVAFGTDCLVHLRGMYALAIVDQRERSLFMARDRMGIKPLYFARRGTGLVFASEIKSLLEHPRVAVVPNEGAIDDYLALRYVPGPQTLFAGIDKFPPAHYMVWKDGRSHVERYWAPPEDEIQSVDEHEMEECFSELFDEAVRCHMISDRPVGAFLSGGIDSTAIVASMRSQMPNQVKTFSVGFGWEGDELSIAAQTAKDLDCDHHEIVCAPEHMSLLPAVCHHLDEPVGDAIVLPMYLVSRLAHEDVTVVQSGEGADETLGGYFMHRVMRAASRYERYTPDFLHRGLVKPSARALPTSWLNLLFDYPGDLGQRGKRRLLAFLDRLGQDSVSMRYRSLVSLFDDEDLAGLRAAFSPNGALAVQDRNEGDLNSILRWQFDHWLPDDILAKQDKMSMANSIEGRVPFMDHRLVEFMMRLPARMKLRFGQNKYVLRRHLARAYQPGFAKRRKVPFYIPIDSYLEKEPLKGMVDELLSERSVRKRGLFRWDAVRTLRQSDRSAGFLRGKQVFALVMLELWFRIFVDREAGWV